MSRNGSGVYSLPAGNPVSPSTTIATAWANPTFSDIADELTSSLDRSGRGGMLAQFKAYDGSSGAPGISFSSELNSGIWRESAGVVSFDITATKITTWKADRFISLQTLEADEDVRLKVSGLKTWRIHATGDALQFVPSTAADGEIWDDTLRVSADPATGIWTFYKNVRVGDGTEAAPGLAFKDDTDCGLYRIGANEWGLASGGEIQAKVGAIASSVNYPEFRGAATGNVPGIFAGGSDANVGLALASKGTGDVQIRTNDTVEQVRVEHVASANRYLKLKGSNGGKPTVTTSAGALALESATGEVSVNGALQEKKVAVSASEIDLATGNLFTKTISGNTTFTVANTPATGTVAAFILELTNGGSATVTWWSGMKWDDGLAPALTAAGRDVLGFYTHDGGTTWTGVILAQDAS